MLEAGGTLSRVHTPVIILGRSSLLDGVAGAPLLPNGGLDAGHGLVQIGVRLVE